MQEPFQKVLDPAFSIAVIQDVMEDVSPLLRELINHATWAYQRCQAEFSSHGGIEEDLAPLTLYRQVIEATDAVEVLLGNSCVDATVPLLRTSLEAWLSLEYILKDDFARRSLSWLCEHVHNRLRTYRLLDRSVQVGQDFRNAWRDEMGEDGPTHPDTVKAIANLESHLREPHMVPIEQEYQSRRGHPRWFSLFGGPPNMREVARNLGHLIQYDVLYRIWSGLAHASDLSGHLSRSSTGEGAFKSIRYPEHIVARARDAVNFQLAATRKMLAHYRPGEEASLSRWYTEEVKPKIERMDRLRIRMNIVEES